MTSSEAATGGRVVITLDVVAMGPRRARAQNGRPVYSGCGNIDYVCGACGSLLAEGMSPAHIPPLPVRCAVCGSANAARGFHR